MKKSFLIVLMIIIIFSCEKEKIQSTEDIFANEVKATVEKEEIVLEDIYIPIKDNETLSYRIEKDPNSRRIFIIAIAESKGEERTLKTINPWSQFDTAYIVKDRLYYLNGLRENEGFYSLYYFDALTGEIVDLEMITDGSYDVTSNNELICYSANEYEKKTDFGSIYRPVIYIKNLLSQETVRFDFSDTFLNDIWGAGAYITYNSDKNIFHIEFAMDSPENFAEGYVDIDSLSFYEIKD